MKEIEILVEVKSSKSAALKSLERFTSHGAKRTLDIYFADPLRNDLRPDDHGRLRASFRIRQKGSKCSMTYKTDFFGKDDEWLYSDEHETTIGDFEIALRIVEQLGLNELIRIDNEKHVFTTPEYEMVLEDVKDLGLFLEVENLGHVDDDQVASVKKGIRDFLKSLDISFGHELNAGKPELMLARLKSMKI